MTDKSIEELLEEEASSRMPLDRPHGLLVQAASEIRRLLEELTNLRTTTNIQAMQSASVPVLSEVLAAETARRESAEAALCTWLSRTVCRDPDGIARVHGRPNGRCWACRGAREHFDRFPKKDP